MIRQKRKIDAGKRIPVFGLFLLCLTAAFLQGCQMRETESAVSAETQTDGAGEEEEQELGMEAFVGEESYEQSFTKPEVDLNIYVDLEGYTPKDQKHAYFIGEDLSDTFYVYDSTDDRLVYTGKIENAEKYGKTSISDGDFTELTEPGTYYIQTAVIGRSYTFSIDEDRYAAQFSELLSDFLKTEPAAYYTAEESGDGKEIYASFRTLLCAWQFFGDQLGDQYAEKLSKHAAWLLEQGAELTDAGEEYAFAAAMAVYSTVNSNDTLAPQCLREAQKAYQAAKKSMPDGGAGQYEAAAALYSAAGSYAFHNDVKTASGLSADESFWGDLSYLTTTRSVDTNLCEQKMAAFLNMCGEYADNSALSPFGMACAESDILRAAVELTIADYIIVSQEYRNVCKEQVHYVMHDGQEKELSHSQKSALLLIMSNLAESEETK